MQQISKVMTHQTALTSNVKVFLCPIFVTHKLQLNVLRTIDILPNECNKRAKSPWSFYVSIKTHDALVLNQTEKNGNSSHKFLCIPFCQRSTWVEFYRDVAFCASMRSKDPILRAGCVIVHPKSLRVSCISYHCYVCKEIYTQKHYHA